MSEVTRNGKYRVFNGTAYETIYLKTTADQVIESGTKKFVSQAEKDAWNSKAAGNHDHDSVYRKIADSYTKTEVDSALAGKANSSHNHNVNDILTTEAKQFVSNIEKARWNNTYTKEEVTSALVNITDTISANETANTAAHNKLKTDLTSADAALEARVDTKLAGKANTSHTHANTDITGLGTASTRNVGNAAGQIPLVGSDGFLATSIIPKIAINDTFTVASRTAAMALTNIQNGDIVVVQDMAIPLASPMVLTKNSKKSSKSISQTEEEEFGISTYSITSGSMTFICVDATATVFDNKFKPLQSASDSMSSAEIESKLATKVDKISGKGLSTNDYTTDEKNKLAGIANNANNYSHPVGDGNLHVPATSTTNNGKVLMAGASAGSVAWTTLLPSSIATDINAKFVSEAQISRWDNKADKNGNQNEGFNVNGLNVKDSIYFLTDKTANIGSVSSMAKAVYTDRLLGVSQIAAQSFTIMDSTVTLADDAGQQKSTTAVQFLANKAMIIGGPNTIIESDSVSVKSKTNAVAIDSKKAINITAEENVVIKGVRTQVINDLYTDNVFAKILKANELKSVSTNLVLNVDGTGAGVAGGTAGITIKRGTAADAMFVYDETSGKFKAGLANALNPVATEAWVSSNYNNYVHPSTHPASMITESSTKKFVTDAQIADWNSKATGSHNHDSVYRKISDSYNRNETEAVAAKYAVAIAATQPAANTQAVGAVWIDTAA